MIHSVKFTCVLDTNVIYPIEIRDLLLWFAHFDLYTPKWSVSIFAEWEAVMRRKGLSEPEIQRRMDRVNRAFPDAIVNNYETLIDLINLPDIDDRHVLAAAIKCEADIIVTNNLRDFPQVAPDTFGLTAKSADDFLTDIIDINHGTALDAFKTLVRNRRNPDLDEYQVLNLLRKNELADTANYLHSLL
jgi:predicted nucleic acid-binding protein